VVQQGNDAAGGRGSRRDERPPWKPTMTRAEAERWTAASAFPAPLYHVTSAQAAEAIMQTGFSLQRIRFGRFYGNGIYTTPNPDVAAYYAGFHLAPPSTLELRADVNRVLRVQVDPSDPTPAFEQIIEQIPGGMDRYASMELDPDEIPPDGNVRPVVVTRMVIEAGYDALEIVEPKPTPAVGGHQLIVFGSHEKVVVVTDG
jgi:hypothetical protein